MMLKVLLVALGIASVTPHSLHCLGHLRDDCTLIVCKKIELHKIAGWREDRIYYESPACFVFGIRSNGALNSKWSGDPCRHHRSFGGIRHALLGCKITPIWFVFYTVIAAGVIVLIRWGGLSLVAIEDGDFLAGIIGVSLSTTLCCVVILIASGYL